MNNLALLLTFAGIAHFGVLVASATVPKALNWRENLRPLPKLLRQMFWVYGSFIVLMIVSFGVITLGHTETLARGDNPLARSVCGMIALFWSVRLLVQFFVFDAKYSNSQIQSRMPKRFWMLGEAVESCQAPWALGDSTNAAQRQKHPVPKGWDGIGSIAALRPRGKPFWAVRRRRALLYPQWRSHIRGCICEFEY